jgi:hypothetical protein
LNLQFSLKPEGFTAPATARVWVLGFAPKNERFGVLSDTYLFKTEAGIWDVLHQSFNYDQLAFKHIPDLQSTQEILVTTGVRKGDLTLLGVEMNVFYQVGDNPIQHLGRIFPH